MTDTARYWDDIRQRMQDAAAIAACRAARIPVYYFSARGADGCIKELCRTMAARKE